MEKFSSQTLTFILSEKSSEGGSKATSSQTREHQSQAHDVSNSESRESSAKNHQKFRENLRVENTKMAAV